MDAREKITHISRLPLFSQLTREELAIIEPLFSEEQFRAGQYIYRQAEYSFALYLFVAGRGRLLRVGADGIERQGADVEPGEFVGEKSLFVYEERPNSLVVVRDAIVLVLPKRNFDDLIRRHPSIKARLNVRDDVRIQVQEIDFPWLERDEVVLRYTHRHIWAFYRRLLTIGLPMTVFFMVLGVVLTPIVVNMLFLPVALVPLGIVPGIVLPLLFVVYAYFDWQNDWFVVTNQRVVHEEAVLLTFQESRQQAPLKSIQGVTSDQNGPLAETFGFGDLHIMTAGAGGTLIFDTVDDPELLAEVIKNELNRTRSHHAAEDRQKIREEIDRFLGRKTLNRTASENLPRASAPAPPPSPPRAVQTAFQQRLEKINDYLDIRTRIDEGARVIYRKHWLVMWNAVFTPFFFMLITLGVFVTSLIAGNEWPWNTVHPLVRFALFLLLILLEGLWLWYRYEDWHNDLYIIEAQTVTRIHRRPLWLDDEQSTILIRNIQGVNASIRGIWQKALNYGTVTIQTAADDNNPADGTGGETRLPFIYQPHQLQEDILRRQRQSDTDSVENEADRMAEQIARWLAVYHQAINPDDFDEQTMGQFIDKGKLKNQTGQYKSED
ncbi:MAG: cyclic nucleotide-binding domain-containing protein [Anaerolineae bacterium]|nr:cyclic nucleotide-binding domain-containing protein [Anaerolineae bacterium]